MEELRYRQKKKTIWIFTSIAIVCILFILFLWEFNENMRTAELVRNRDTMEDLASGSSASKQRK